MTPIEKDKVKDGKRSYGLNFKCWMMDTAGDLRVNISKFQNNEASG